MSDTATAAVPTVSEAVKAKAKAAVGAIGVWSEWRHSEGHRYFTETLANADQALALVKPQIATTRAAWAKAEAKAEDKFTFEDFIGITKIMVDGWEPDAYETEQVRDLYLLATNDHSASTKAHYLKVVANNPASFTLDLPYYLGWLPKRGEYTNGVRTQAAIDADEAKRVANKSEAIAKRDVVLCSDHSWSGLVTNAATDADRVKRLLALAHDLVGYAEREAEKLGDEGDTIKRAVSKQVSDKVKGNGKAKTSRKSK